MTIDSAASWTVSGTSTGFATLSNAGVLRSGLTLGSGYWHVELDSHDILLAEDMPAESYLDTGNRGVFANAAAALILHPDLANDQARRRLQSCRLFADDAARVEPIWRALAARASAALGLDLPPAAKVTDDPELCVMAGDRVIRPTSRDGGRYGFMLPAAQGPLRLVSRHAMPGEQRPWIEDHRRLGVMVSRLTLRRDDRVDAIALDHPGLGRG